MPSTVVSSVVVTTIVDITSLAVTRPSRSEHGNRSAHEKQRLQDQGTDLSASEQDRLACRYLARHRRGFRSACLKDRRDSRSAQDLRTSAARGAELSEMAPHEATETGHPKRDQRTDALDPVGHPIADCESAKQRRI